MPGTPHTGPAPSNEHFRSLHEETHRLRLRRCRHPGLRHQGSLDPRAVGGACRPEGRPSRHAVRHPLRRPGAARAGERRLRPPAGDPAGRPDQARPCRPGGTGPHCRAARRPRPLRHGLRALLALERRGHALGPQTRHPGHSGSERTAHRGAAHPSPAGAGRRGACRGSVGLLAGQRHSGRLARRGRLPAHLARHEGTRACGGQWRGSVIQRRQRRTAGRAPCGHQQRDPCRHRLSGHAETLARPAAAGGGLRTPAPALPADPAAGGG